MNRLLFELLSKWISGLVPGVALLHIMCKTKRPGEDKNAQHMRCAIPSPKNKLEPYFFVHEGVGR